MSKFSETIFLTGFPGFIAGKLVKQLAKSDTQFFLLVQRNFVEKAMKDIEKISAESNIPLENFALIEGDITKSDLGMSADDLQTVLDETTSVYHLAAIYDLAVKKNIGYTVNVEGTKNVNEVVKKIKNLQRYNYISTCYVAGKRKGLVHEAELAHDAGFHNYYDETKYLAEVEVEKLKADYPVTIFRPAVVVGDSKTGETIKYDGIYYVINYIRKFPALFRLINVGNDMVKVNLVPVDFVVDGIVALAKDERAVGKTIALADPNPLTTAEACDQISLAICGKKSVAKLPPNLMQSILMLPFTPAFSGLPHEGVPYFFSPQEFETGVSTELLSAHGVSCPSFKDYVKTLVKFVEKNPKL
ncbi:MAG: SDR family oxidoreductase [Acidobacteriota bacterium]